MPSLKHTHTLKRHPKQKDVFLCTDPRCFFKNHRDFILGKVFRCYLCNSEYITTKYSLRLAVPHCERCTKSNDSIPRENIPLDTERESFLDIIDALDKGVEGEGI